MRFITMMGTAALTMTAATYADLKLNEIRTGSGNAEYIEITGNPGESLAGVSVIIIGDGAFIGARAEVAEGVRVGEGAVLSMGVYIGQSTKIYNRETGEILYGRVPAGSVVVPGSLPSKDGSYSLYCAVIVKRVDAQTRAKTGINELLRGD